MSDDYSQYTDAALTGSKGVDMNKLQVVAEKQMAAEKKVARLAKELEDAQKELKAVAEIELPELMDSIGIEEFKTSSGILIKVDEVIRASIPKPRAGEAFMWLRDHDHAALIKRKVIVEFGKGEDEKAAALTAELSRKGLEVEDKSDVHAQTLSAFVRDKLSKGEDIPLDLFGVFRQRVAKVKV